MDLKYLVEIDKILTDLAAGVGWRKICKKLLKLRCNNDQCLRSFV